MTKRDLIYRLIWFSLCLGAIAFCMWTMEPLDAAIVGFALGVPIGAR